MRPFLFLITAALASAVFGSDAESDGWQIHVDLRAARQSAGAQWLMNTVFTNLLSRELLPGQTADYFLQRGTDLFLTAPPTNPWSNVVVAVSGIATAETARTFGALRPIALGDVAAYSLSSATSTISRARPSRYGAIPNSNLSVHPRRIAQPLATTLVVRDGDRLLFGSDRAKLTASVKRLRHVEAATVKTGWLDGRFRSTDQDLRDAQLTLCDGESGELRVDISLSAPDAATATRLAEQLRRLLRMFEQIEFLKRGSSTASRVSDSLNIELDGTAVNATFAVPADIVRAAASPRTNQE